MRMCHFRAQNGPFVLNKLFLVQTIIIFIYLLPLFTVQNLKRFLLQIQSSEDAPFFGPKWSICPKQFFFGKLFLLLSSTYQLLSLCKIFKKFFLHIQSYEMRNFWAQMRIFFRKPVNEPCSFHSCLSTCQKSKSDINLLVKY